MGNAEPYTRCEVSIQSRVYQSLLGHIILWNRKDNNKNDAILTYSNREKSAILNSKPFLCFSICNCFLLSCPTLYITLSTPIYYIMK